MIHRKMKMVTVFWPSHRALLEGKRSVTAVTSRAICRFVRTRVLQQTHNKE